MTELQTTTKKTASMCTHVLDDVHHSLLLVKAKISSYPVWAVATYFVHVKINNSLVLTSMSVSLDQFASLAVVIV